MEDGGDALTVGFIGAGKMAYGILTRMLQTGKIPPQNVLVSTPSDRNLGKFRALGCRTTHSNVAVPKDCKVVILATKPHILPEVLKEVASTVTKEHTLVSLAAGITLKTLESLPPPGTSVLRALPTLPCVVQAGAAVFCRGCYAGDQQAALLKTVMLSCSLCEEVLESYIDIHTGLSGSGVAYVYTFAEALVDGAIKMGMPSDLANRVAAQTLLGAAKMILETVEHPAKLRNGVCTPGGTTIHALHELEKGGLRAAVMNAVEAAMSRAREIGKQ